MIFIKFVVAVGICLWIYILWRRRKYYKLIFQLPGDIGWPLIGKAFKFLNSEAILPTLEEYEKKFGTLYFSWMGTLPFLVTSEPQMVQDILTSPTCVNKSIVYNAVKDGSGDGLFSLRNPDWSVHRKLLNPSFNHGVLLSFFPIFNEEVNNLMISLNELCGKYESDLSKLLQTFTISIATRTTMGTSVTFNQASGNEKLLESYCCVIENVSAVIFSPWLSIELIQRLLGKYTAFANAKKNIRDFTKALIYKKLSVNDDSDDLQREDETNVKTKNIFINIAIELLKKGQFTQQHVEDESNTIVLGAFETTANTISYVLMLLSMFPEYQQKAYEEILSIFPNAGNFEVTYADIQQMNYMDLIINESMRLIAPVPLVVRETSDDLQLSNGLIIPEGVQVAINIFHMHRNKAIWGPQAHTFNPDHFLPSNMEGKHPYAFIPFTKGIRNCIGWKYGLMSSKVTLAKLLRNYRFTTSFNFEDLVYDENITMKLKPMPKLEIYKRTN